MLVNGFDAWVETAKGSYALSSQIYPPDVLHPDGATRIVDFKTDIEIASAQDAYKQQVAVYVEAVQRATGQPATGVLLRV